MFTNWDGNTLTSEIDLKMLSKEIKFNGRKKNTWSWYLKIYASLSIRIW